MRGYKTIGFVKSEKLKREIPVLDIPIMSDEKWKELTNTPEQIKYIKKMRGAKTLLRLDKYIILRTTKERHAIYKKYLQSRKNDRSGCILYEKI